MCLTIKHRFSTREAAESYGRNSYMIAKKNITVYKKLYKRGEVYVSPHKDFVYKKGTHYYQTSDWCTFSVSTTLYGTQLEINQGLHAYVNPMFACQSRNSVVVKMIIPKGSKYFVGVDGDIVSDNLIWK